MDDVTPDDIRRMRLRLNQKALHQLNVYITHIGQLHGMFDTALALLVHGRIPDAEVPLWHAVDAGLTSLWGPAGAPAGRPLSAVGKLDAEELLTHTTGLIRALERRFFESRRRLYEEVPGPDASYTASVELTLALSVSAQFLAQITLALRHWLPHLPAGATPEELEGNPPS